MIRICAWISLIFYTILSLVTFAILFLEELNISAIVSLTMFAAMAYTGWSAKKIKSLHFKRTKFAMVTAIISLLFGVLFITLAPFVFAKSYGIGDSYESIIVLLIMFIPAVVSSIALILKKHNVEQMN